MAKKPSKFEDKTIEQLTASNRAAARAMAIDAQRRSADALGNTPAFSEPAHVQTVEQVKTLVKDFFTVHNGMYVNHRENKGKPFTVIKLDKVTWPLNRLGFAKNAASLRADLTNLNVIVVNSARSNSMLFRIPA